MTVTVRDIAKRVNVSHTMVSRALNANNTFPISAEKRELIRRAAEELGYRPNHAARILATGQSFLIALQIYDMENPHQMRVARLLGDILREDKYDLLIHGYHGDSISVRSSIDGVIILDRKDSPRVDVHSPVVAIGAFVSEVADSVLIDLHSGAAEAMAHLIGSGRRRIALVSTEDNDPTDGRTRAYLESVAAAGLPPRLIHLPRHGRIDGWMALSEALRSGDIPDALLCENDQVAEGCYRALREANLRIPEDVAVVGCDGISQSEFVYPSLATIEQPAEAMCRAAWKFLRRRIEERSIPRQSTTIKSHFVRRASC